MDWLKKPENIMTGIVLAAALTQPRREGQKPIGQVGQAALAALGFRGGLQAGVQAQEERERDFQQRSQVQNRQLAQGDTRNQIEREQLAQQATEGAANRATQLQIAGTARPDTPAEAALMNAQAGYYNRMPTSGSENDPNKFKDPYEEEIFKHWFEGETNKAAMEGKVFQLNPIAWLQHIQPYRNARTQVDAMRSQGLMGEIVQDNTGAYKVRVVGVADPTNNPAATVETPAPNPAPGTSAQEPVVTLSPQVDPTEQIVGLRGNKTGPGRGGGSTIPGGPDKQREYLNTLDEAQLRSLLRRATGRGSQLATEELRMIKEALKAKANAKPTQ